MANDRGSDLIESAITEALTEFEDAEDGDILVEWVVVAYVSNPEIDGYQVYPMLYSNGTMPSHRVRGLLATGLKVLDDD